MSELYSFLEKIYHNPSTSSQSIEGLFKNAHRCNSQGLTFTKNDITNFLNKQPNYLEYHAPITPKKYWQRKTTVVKNWLLKWQMDLIDMQNYAAHNRKVRYVLTIVDCFSRYAMAFPIINKKGKTIARILFQIFRTKVNNLNFAPLILQSDNGTEFKNEHVEFVCSLFGIIQIFSYPYSPLGIIERFNKTIKDKIKTHIAMKTSTNLMIKYNYIDALPQLLKNYNTTIHSTIKDDPEYITFCDIDTEECKQAIANTYKILEQILYSAPEISELYKIGDRVKVMNCMNPKLLPKEQFEIKKKFGKVGQRKWTKDEFEVVDIHEDAVNPNIVKYTIKANNTIFPRRYYHHELLKIHQ
jgi:transposase InsO family protein